MIISLTLKTLVNIIRPPLLTKLTNKKSCVILLRQWMFSWFDRPVSCQLSHCVTVTVTVTELSLSLCHYCHELADHDENEPVTMHMKA